MRTKPVKVYLDVDRGRSVTITAQCRYTGTGTGGNRNHETHEVTWHGVTMDGSWDGDARHDITVYEVPVELRARLEAVERAEQDAREERAVAKMSAEERRFYFNNLARR